MDKPVKFSIIISAYNVEKYIGECIESILSQSYKNYEILIVDDGSDDKTGQIVEKYAENEVRIKLYHQQNSGPSRARNTGINKAQGEYMLFMDSDDAYKNSEALEILARKCDGVDMAAYAWEEFDETGILEIMMEFPEGDDYKECASCSGKEYLEKALNKKHQYAWYCWRYAYKTEFWKRNGFEFKDGYKYEDVNLIPWVVLKAETIICVRKVLYRYRINRTGAITMDRSAATDLDYLSVITQNVQQVCEVCDCEAQNLRKLLCNNFSDMYYTVMILCSQYRGKSGYDEVLKKLKSSSWITDYTIDTKQKVLKHMIKLIGLDKTIWMLGIRKKIRHGKRK